MLWRLLPLAVQLSTSLVLVSSLFIAAEAFSYVSMSASMLAVGALLAVLPGQVCGAAVDALRVHAAAHRCSGAGGGGVAWRAIAEQHVFAADMRHQEQWTRSAHPLLDVPLRAMARLSYYTDQVAAAWWAPLLHLSESLAFMRRRWKVPLDWAVFYGVMAVARAVVPREGVLSDDVRRGHSAFTRLSQAATLGLLLYYTLLWIGAAWCAVARRN